MTPNEFDRLLKKKLSQVPYPYDESDWEEVQMRLTLARAKKRIPFGLLASGLAASIALLALGVSQFRSKDLASSSLPLRQVSIQKAPVVAATTKSRITTVKPTRSEQTERLNTVPKTYNLPLKSKDTNNDNRALASNASPVKEALQSPEEHKSLTSSQKTYHPQQESQMPLYENSGESENNKRGINFSIAGGINYGNRHTGYAIGAIATKPLSNKIGVEVRLAYVNNSVVPGGGPSSSGPGSVFQPGHPSAPTNLTLNYLQLASMTDFNVTKKLTLSAGADIQKLLQERDIAILYNDAEKVIPAVDMGLLLRTEYGLSDRLRAGMSYRLGMKNAISSEKNYLERNYMQVEFRYKLY